MSFSADIQKAIEKYKIGFNDVVRLSLLDLTRSIVMMTPVDTGRAQNNWEADIDMIPTGTNNKTRPASAVIEQAESKTRRAGGNIYYLVNNLSYIRKLEGTGVGDGYSRRAPNGMVRVSLQNYPQYLKNAVENLT